MRVPIDQVSGTKALRRRPLFAPLLFPALGFAAVLALLVWLVVAWQQTSTVLIAVWDEQSLDGESRSMLLRLVGSAEVDAAYAVEPSPFAGRVLFPPGDPLPRVAPAELDALAARVRGGSVLLVVRQDRLAEVLEAFGIEAGPEPIAPGSLVVVSIPRLGSSSMLRFRTL